MVSDVVFSNLTHWPCRHSTVIGPMKCLPSRCEHPWTFSMFGEYSFLFIQETVRVWFIRSKLICQGVTEWGWLKNGRCSVPGMNPSKPRDTMQLVREGACCPRKLKNKRSVRGSAHHNKNTRTIHTLDPHLRSYLDTWNLEQFTYIHISHI